MAAQVIKKVKEHHKKKAKLDKKLGRKAKKEKDPGIPGQWPFKEELLKELEWEKQRAAAETKRKKEERRLAQVWLLWCQSQYHCSSKVSGAGLLSWRRPEADLGAPSRQVQRRETMRWLMDSQWTMSRQRQLQSRELSNLSRQKASTSGRGANTGKPHCADMQLTLRMSQGICTPAEIEGYRPAVVLYA